MAGGGGGVAANQDTLSGEPINSYNTGGLTPAQNNMSSGSGGFMPNQNYGSGFALDRNLSEPVIKYGTGGRITGGRMGPDGIRRFAMAGAVDDNSTGTMQYADSGFGGGSDWYDGGGFGDFNFGGSDNGNDVPEIIITTDRPSNDGSGIDSLDIFNPNDILFTDFTGDDVSEIIITTDRPTQVPIDTFTFDSSDILITDWVTETDSEDISEIIITTDRPTRTPLVTDTISVTDLDTVTWVTETDTEDVSEIIITTDRPTTTPVVTDTLTDTDSVTWVTETDTETETDTVTFTETTTDTETDTPTVTETETDTDTETDTIWWTDPPTLPPVTDTPRPTYTPRPTLPPVTDTPRPTTTPVPRAGIYRPQYQNYADPLTMFNVSNYGRDPVTSAGYNYATAPGNMGIAQLNQNLRDFADQQMAQTYPDGSPKGADMDAVLSAMRSSGLTATDLENARYGRTTGLNTPFSQYNKVAPTSRMFGDLLAQNFGMMPNQLRNANANNQTFGGGIAELIKMLPK